MTIFIATFIVITIAVLGMAIGIILGRPAIKGSCGGLNQIGLAGSCSGACSIEEQKICDKRKTTTDNND